MSKRYLKENMTIRLRNGSDPSHPFERNFTILKRMKSGVGSSCVCYEARHQNSEAGVLKEFYPESPVYQRKSDGQLVKNGKFPALEEKIQTAEEEFIRPYQILLEAKRKNPELSAFIPYFEMYQGTDSEGQPVGTRYIFSVEPKVETFEAICEKIHKKPGTSPEKSLLQVLEGLLSLTESIAALHCMDIFHRDIKPANFGFLRQGDRLLTQKPTLFDVDTICRGDEQADLKGTPEFMDPESFSNGCSNQSDLYAIGCCLFYAVCGSEKTRGNGYLYRPEDYPELEEIVNASELLQASKTTYHRRTRASLLRILKKCLAPRSLRYEGAEMLESDLREVISFILPASSAAGKHGAKWVLSDMESLSRPTDWDVCESIQCHLYRHPLYESLEPDEREIRVLCLGSGDYAHNFLDAALQAGQMRNMNLRVCVASEDRSGFEEYLLNRPDLVEFFNVENSIPDGKPNYGSLHFEELPMDRSQIREAVSSILKMLSGMDESSLPNYVFVSLADSRLNEQAAKAIHRALRSIKKKATVGYVSDEAMSADSQDGTPRSSKKEAERKAIEIPLKTGFHQIEELAEIERLAFNTHFVWEKGMNVSFSRIKKAFRDRYNHASSIACALHLKYKLFSIGIDLDRISFEEAARLFHEMELDQPDDLDNTVKNELLWVEHRRWVVEKLVDGYSLRQPEQCLGGQTSDKALKNHNCLLFSRPDQRLALMTKSHPEFWDEASAAQIQALDPLDQMSVALHRGMKNEADKILAKRLADNQYLKSIEKHLEGRPEKNAFQEWVRSIQGIRSGYPGQDRIYPMAHDHFLNSLSEYPELTRNQIRSLVDGFDAHFHPVLASRKKQNWKSNDTLLIENIPFILTYNEDSSLAIPFSAESQSEIFQNAAPVLMANPANVIYLVYLRQKVDAEKFMKAMPGFLNFLNRKSIRSRLRFLFLVREEAAAGLNKPRLSEIRGMDRRIQGANRIVLRGNAKDGFDQLSKLLETEQEKRGYFAIERNSTPLSEQLDGRGFYDRLPSCSFDSVSLSFREHGGGRMLEYIRKSPFITVEDMAALRCSRGVTINNPDLGQDYRDLWELFKSNSWAWKLMAKALENHDLETGRIAVFQPKKIKTADIKQRRFLLPEFTVSSVQKVMTKLKKNGLVGTESEVLPLNSTTIEVTLSDLCGNYETFVSLFSDPYRLMLPDALEIKGDHSLSVYFNSLKVDDFILPEEKQEDCYYLLQSFRRKNLILNLKFNPEKTTASFTYASEEAKQLISQAGRILEVFVYQNTLEEGAFDSLGSSVKIEWKDEGISNEFDMILTRGFQTLFVECKETNFLDQNYYYQISRLAEYFGVNAKVVLIGDTMEGWRPHRVIPNERQRIRGKELEVITISNPAEIARIGITLNEILNGTYQQKNKNIKLERTLQ